MECFLSIKLISSATAWMQSVRKSGLRSNLAPQGLGSTIFSMHSKHISILRATNWPIISGSGYNDCRRWVSLKRSDQGNTHPRVDPVPTASVQHGYPWQERAPTEIPFVRCNPSGLKINTPFRRCNYSHATGFSFLCSPSHFGAHCMELAAEANLGRQGRIGTGKSAYGTWFAHCSRMKGKQEEIELVLVCRPFERCDTIHSDFNARS